MATVLKTPTIRVALPPRPTTTASSKSEKPFCVSFRQSTPKHSRLSSLCFSRIPSFRFVKFVPFASSGETETTDTQEEVQQPQQAEDILDGADRNEDVTSDDVTGAEEVPPSVVISLLQSYKEALASNDESRVAEIESLLKSVEDGKTTLERKVTDLSEELTTEKARILRISADFDNFRKRTERERVSLLTNAQGEVVESLLPVLDNFERAKAQIKVETDGEEKINNSYQSIYKQFMEILSSLGVVPVETVGNPFDPLLHEAIMRGDSDEYEEDIVIEEFRKGFKLGDRLLRPSMVKVSAGPGPAKSDQVESSEGHETSKTAEEEGATVSDST